MIDRVYLPETQPGVRRVEPHKALLVIAGLDVTEGVGDLRARYLRKYGAGLVAEKVWNDPSFTLGFEYGLLALAAFIEEKGARDARSEVEPPGS